MEENNDLDQNLENISEEELEEEVLEDLVTSKVYVKKEYLYNETRSSGYTFLLVGIVGLLAAFLYVIGLFTPDFIKNMSFFSQVVIVLMFVACVVFGMVSLSRCKQLKRDALRENQATDDIINWFKDTYNVEAIESKITDNDDNTLYFDRINIIKELLTAKFDNLEEIYLDDLCDNIYSDMFE